MSPETKVEAYNQLLQRAVKIVCGPPEYNYIPNQEIGALSIEGETARLSWCDTEGNYRDEGDHLVVKSAEFPARLLIVSEDEFGKWQQGEQESYDAEQKAKREERKLAAEHNERDLLLALKAKYERTIS